MKKPPVILKLHKKNKEAAEGYIYLRVGVPGEKEYSYKSLGYKLPVKFWDEKSSTVKKGFPNYELINTDIHRIKNELDTDLSLDKSQGKEFTKRNISHKLHGSKSANGSFLTYFLQYLEFISAERKGEKQKYSAGYVKHWKVEYKRLEKYLGASKLEFSDINQQFLEDYESYISKDINSNTTLNTIFKRLKFLLKRAIERDLMNASQIAGYYWPTYIQPERSYLTADEVESISKLVYTGHYKEDPTMEKIAAYFVIECYSGIRFSDWGKFKIEKLIENDALKVRTTKTNQPIYLYLKYWPKLARMVEFVRGREMIFDIKEQVTNRYLKIVAKEAGIKHIEVTTHVGRHTCATLLAELGYDTSKVAEVLGVSEGTVKVYMKATRKGLMDAQERLGGL